VTVLTVKRVDGMLELVRANLPRRVQSAGDFEDWEVIGPALVALVADLFEGIVSSSPPRARLRADILARSLAEYAIAFAWLTAEASERSGRIKSLLLDEFRERRKAGNKLEKEIAGRTAYDDLFDPSKRAGGPLPKSLLDDAVSERLKKLEADPSIKPLPNAFDMAFAADKHWMSEVDLVEHNPYALIYFTLFTGPSFSTHPSITAVAKMVTGQPPELAVGAAEPLGESEMPYGQSFLVLTNTLLISARSLGWPDESVVRRVLARD
jgi:hypothetical protein